MILKRILPISVILLAVLAAFCRYQEPCLGNIDITHQNGWQGIFVIKVERRLEKCKLLPGAHYTFLSRRGNSENWQEIMTFRYDDPIGVSSENIHIVNDKVAYIFLIDRYAVTTDSGKTWKIWDAEKDLTDWKRAEDEYPNWARIVEINIAENGSGKMKLERLSGKKGLIIELNTDDFGKTWIP